MTNCFHDMDKNNNNVSYYIDEGLDKHATFPYWGKQFYMYHSLESTSFKSQ